MAWALQKTYLAIVVVFIWTTMAHAVCWNFVAKKYGISPVLLYAIAKVESGLNPDAVNHNKNGSRDIGLMQINSYWIPKLKAIGITEKDLHNSCTNLQVGAWILAHDFLRYGKTWKAVGAYNASNKEARKKYIHRVIRQLAETMKNQQPVNEPYRPKGWTHDNF